jgi:hypothetical protein
MWKPLNPADASTMLSKVINVLYLLAFLVTLAVALLRGDPLPVLPSPCPVAVEQAAPAAPPSAPLDVLPTSDVAPPDVAE